MQQVTVQSLGLDRTSNTPVVILEEEHGGRVLPIWIGPGEASAIAMELADMKFSRPLTHDLFTSTIRGLGGTLRRVNITKVVDNTYYAELIVHRGGEVLKIDARPSDSIAIALRTDAGIYTSDELLEHTAIEVADAEQEEWKTASASASGGSSEADDEEESGGLESDALKEHLRDLDPEDFGRFSR